MSTSRIVAVALASALGLASAADAAVTLKIRNYSGKQVWVMWTGTSGLSGTSNGISIAPSDYGSNAAGYDLSTFNAVEPLVYQVDNFTMGGGRMWFTYGGASWAFTGPGYTPPMANFNDPNFPLRYDKVEAYIMGSTTDNLDITAVDAFSIPFEVKAFASASPSTTTQRLKGSLGKPVYDALGAVAANAKAGTPATPAGASPPLAKIAGNSPYLVINANSQGTSTSGGYRNSPIGSTGDFIRVLANDNIVAPFGGDPVVAANNAQIPENYQWTTYDTYLRRMDGRAHAPYTGTTSIQGSFAGVPPFSTTLQSPATYNLTATFNPTEQMTVTYTVPGSGAGTGPYTIAFTGFVTISGTATVTSGTGPGTYTVEIKIPYGGLPQYMTVQPGFANPRAFLLDPSGVVGANANYLYKFYPQGSAVPAAYTQTNPYGGGPQNNILTWAEGDLLAGMNVGTVGSDKTLPQSITINGNTYAAGTKVGTFRSQDWWSLGSTLRGSSPGSVYDYYFGYLQPDHDYYNRYAEVIYPFTDAYGFAYSDRITDGRAAIAWNAQGTTPIDTVEITILPDRGEPAAVAAVEAIEYFNDELEDYFVTSLADEIAKLDAGQIRGWWRTGRTMRVFPTQQPGSMPVCRYYIPPSLGESHFLGRNGAECNPGPANAAYALESLSVMYLPMPVAGACPQGSVPVYRLFSNRPNTNHRYTTDAAVKWQMVARGWLAEGDGADSVTMCSPL